MMNAVETLSIDAVIDKVLVFCEELPKLPEYLRLTRNINNLRERLAGGRLHLAVLGQFNRGKSSFINALLGINVLPVSVLPITSVPTVISYGETNHCRISFSDEKNDESVEGDIKAIHSLLEKYATEKNNPKNRLCVSEIIVRCESALLQHGTVIIDTPGFGSTHTHNTQTTLDYLSTCDAALFLLSADLPITQVEVDFLKSVIETVPRIFFIYNKTDLLNKSELAASEMFIKDTITKTFDFPAGVSLFPVTAKRMSECKKDNELYIKSGFAKIEKEIIEFLLHEKYFTLSEALAGKFKGALEDILKSLNNKKEEILNPIHEIKEEINRIEQFVNTIQAELNKTCSLTDAEETALHDYSQKLLQKRRDSLCKLFDTHLHKLLYTKLKGKPEALITSALSRLFEETFKLAYLSIVTEINKPLRKAIGAHVREMNKLAERIYTELDNGGGDEDALPEVSPERMEIDTTVTWKPQRPYDILPPKASFFERFAGSAKRHHNLIEYYSPLLTSNVDSCLEELSEHIRILISTAFTGFVEEIKEGYKDISRDVNNIYESQTVLLNESEEKVKPDLSKLDYLIEGFNEVKEMLV